MLQSVLLMPAAIAGALSTPELSRAEQLCSAERSYAWVWGAVERTIFVPVAYSPFPSPPSSAISTLCALAQRHQPPIVDVLAASPERIDNRFLSHFEEFRQFSDRSAQSTDKEVVPEPAEPAEQTPDEIMRAAHRRIEAALAEELLDRVRAATTRISSSG